eukprot:Hpha_TRINITY_DN17869_c0_g1::TRINITY_DN17869_c0_g1_i1::g.177571::m.177571
MLWISSDGVIATGVMALAVLIVTGSLNPRRIAAGGSIAVGLAVTGFIVAQVVKLWTRICTGMQEEAKSDEAKKRAESSKAGRKPRGAGLAKRQREGRERDVRGSHVSHSHSRENRAGACEGSCAHSHSRSREGRVRDGGGQLRRRSSSRPSHED